MTDHAFFAAHRRRRNWTATDSAQTPCGQSRRPVCIGLHGPRPPVQYRARQPSCPLRRPQSRDMPPSTTSSVPVTKLPRSAAEHAEKETPMLATLPPVIRITPDTGEAVPSFVPNLQFIAREIASDGSGSRLVLTRGRRHLRSSFARVPRGLRRLPGCTPRQARGGSAGPDAPATRRTMDCRVARHPGRPLAIGFRRTLHRARRRNTPRPPHPPANAPSLHTPPSRRDPGESVPDDRIRVGSVVQPRLPSMVRHGARRLSSTASYRRRARLVMCYNFDST